MHDKQNYFDINAYHEFIQRQSYVDNTHLNPPFIISEPSTNPLKTQSQNKPRNSWWWRRWWSKNYRYAWNMQKNWFVRDAHEESYKIGWNHNNCLQLLFQRVQVVEIRRLQHISLTYHQYSSYWSCEVKSKGSNANFPSTLPLPINYFVILILIIEKN